MISYEEMDGFGKDNTFPFFLKETSLLSLRLGRRRKGVDLLVLLNVVNEWVGRQRLDGAGRKPGREALQDIGVTVLDGATDLDNLSLSRRNVLSLDCVLENDDIRFDRLFLGTGGYSGASRVLGRDFCSGDRVLDIDWRGSDRDHEGGGEDSDDGSELHDWLLV